ncbi:MAG: hypothetical protein WCR95_01080 [Eubacteriales bacterium]|jgi:hypothetical protein
MKTKLRILSALVVFLAVGCVLLSAFLIKAVKNPEENGGKIKVTSPLPAGDGSEDIQFKLSLLHLYYESKDVVSTLPFTTIQVTQGALIKAFMTGPSAAEDAEAYLNRYADRTLNSAFDTMDEIIAKYQSLLTKYNISSSSSYTAKFNKLNSMFASLKNSSKELISRARTLIKMSKSADYDSYYTNYIEQLSDLTGKIEANCSVIMAEYDSLLSSISRDYNIIS